MAESLPTMPAYLRAMNIFILASLALWSCSPYTGERFDPVRWHKVGIGQDLESCTNGPMMRDLIDRVLQPGMARSEVEALLGPSQGRQQRELTYVVGACSGLGVDFDLLHIDFDTSGRLTGARMEQH